MNFPKQKRSEVDDVCNDCHKKKPCIDKHKAVCQKLQYITGLTKEDITILLNIKKKKDDNRN